METLSGEAPDYGPAKGLTGVEWLDTLTYGGLPTRRMTLLLGGAGAGKTLLACQIAASRAQRLGSSAIFVALEEPPGDVVRNVAGFSWDLASLLGTRFHPIDVRPDPDTIVAGDFDLRGLLASVATKAQQTGADLVILDGLDHVLGWLPDQGRRLAELARIGRWLEEQALTGVITAKAGPAGTSLNALNLLEFAVSLVIMLDQQSVPAGAVRALRISKYRGSRHSTAETPLFVTRHGLEPLGWRGILPSSGPPAAEERVSSGMARLDALLGGGYFRGSTALLSGPPGTGKSTLAALFAEGTCRRGERCAYVAFDEGPQQTIRNMRSVGIDLARHQQSGALMMVAMRPGQAGAEQTLTAILAAVEQHGANSLVVDPVSSLLQTSVPELGRAAVRRLVDEARTLGMTAVLTSLVRDARDPAAMTLSEVSTIADAWIGLDYADRGGERNRTLSIVKARGSAHSNQTREFIMSAQGCSLADVYTAGGDVLLGTARLEREARERLEELQARLGHQRRRKELLSAIAETEAGNRRLAHELEAARAELAGAEAAEAERLTMLADRRRRIEASRFADRDRRATPPEDNTGPAEDGCG